MTKSGQNIILKNVTVGPEGMAQTLREMAALEEDQGLSTASTWRLTTTCNSSSSGSNALFWPVLSLYVCGAHTYTQAKHVKYVLIHTYNSPYGARYGSACL